MILQIIGLSIILIVCIFGTFACAIKGIYHFTEANSWASGIQREHYKQAAV